MTKRVTTVFGGVPGAPYYSNMYFADADDAAACVAAVDEFWDSVAGAIVNECFWSVEAEVVTINVANGQPTAFETVTGDTGTGSNSSELLPPATQELVSWTTAQVVNGRRVRGRTFIPALGLDQDNEGFVASSAIAGQNAAALALINDPDTTFGIYSRTHGLFAAVTGGACWNQFATMRSRRD